MATSYNDILVPRFLPVPTDTTKAILGNLTMLVYEIAMLNGMQVPGRPPQPEPFSPDLTDQIVTMLWYSSLLFSVGSPRYFNVEQISLLCS